MPSRTAKFVSAIFVNILAGLLLATAACGEPAAADGCLSTPWGDAPAGSHWRYHIDHVNKRNCWYLRNESGGVSQVSPQNSSATPPPPAKPSVADARAELRQRAPREDTAQASQPAAQASPPAAIAEKPASAPGNEVGSASTSVRNATAAVATRWPDLPALIVPKATPGVAAPANEARRSSADSAQAIIPSIPLAHWSMRIRPETIPTLIAAAFGALAFAGAAMLIARRTRSRRLRGRIAQSARGPISETTDDDRIILSDHPYQDNRDYRPRFARGVGTAAASNRKMEFARRAPRYAQR